MTKRSYLLFLITLSLSASESILAQGFLKDILTKSPGPLTKHHQEWDAIQGCVSCHANRLGGEVVDVKCMDCHPDIKARVTEKRGFHKDKADCHTCHAEHKGKGAYIFAPNQNWMQDFNHSETEYELLGQHKKADCRDCHQTYRQHWQTKAPTQTESYLNAPTTCLECHQKDYEHKFSKEEWLTCTQCHSSGIENWRKMAARWNFNHSTTDYPLEGLHTKVACATCHEPDAEKRRVTTFAPLEFNQCTDCHYDVHENAYGQSCTTCHSVFKDWSVIGQNKDAKSGKKIEGFDHSKTKFPLNGYHQAVSCESCHSDPNANFKFPSADKFDECSDCHGFAHGIQFADQKCVDCHAEDRKFDDSTFDLTRHNKTKFPLDGKHQVIDCAKCHYSGDYENIPSAQCDDCHRNPHDKRQIEKECSFCHVTSSFSWIQFDHNRQTDFRLTGKHIDVACLSCHVDQIFKDMPASNSNPNCQGCHADPHGDKMPNDCASCHATEGFKLVRNFDHFELTNFPLDGRHAELTCQKCHADHLKGNYRVPTTSSQVKASACANCHVDVHAGKYGNNCESCHNVNTFSVEYGSKVHDLGFFKLEGFHDQMGCTDCHRPDTNLQGVGDNCQWCHEKNDIHLGRMGPACQDCHSQTAWMPTKFKHNTTGFRLTGAHRYVECNACHKNQIFSGLPSDCYFCHSDSYLNSTIVPQHSSAAGSIVECSTCHSAMSWTIRRGGGLQ